jgi:hypothetical protein
MNSLKSILMNSSNYYIKLVVLFIFWKIIKRHPKFKDYKKETVFSMYRSLMCLFFMLYSLENLICNFTDLLNCPIKERGCYQNIK